MKRWNDLRYTFLFWVLMYRTVEREREGGNREEKNIKACSFTEQHRHISVAKSEIDTSFLYFDPDIQGRNGPPSSIISKLLGLCGYKPLQGSLKNTEGVVKQSVKRRTWKRAVKSLVCH